MRALTIILFNLILLTFIAKADETFPVLKVGPDVYTNVTVTSITATDIYFTYGKNMANAKLKNLDPEMQKHFHYDAAKMEAAAKKIAAENAKYSPEGIAALMKTIDHSNAQAIMDGTIVRVKAIINQPVRSFPRTSEMQSVGSTGAVWFHPGAIKPDFNTVDVRKSQEFAAYANYRYSTSDLTPNVVFLSDEIEFNSMTKYFYVDRSLPKKKLTGPEMEQINRLYRIIGKCEDALK